MSWWIYKCNAQRNDYQGAWGDWSEFFGGNPKEHWGGTKWVPALAKLNKGDLIIAYQTDRNELVGLARVRQSCERNSYLYLDPIETIRVKVRPLKKANPDVAAIPALRPGPIMTIYPISESDAQRLLKAAGACYVAVAENRRDVSQTTIPSRGHGGGFGRPENNAVVESAAIDFVTKTYRQRGWTVKSVEREKCGFDLKCKRGKVVRDVEVKGVAGTIEAFIITAGEVRQAKDNRDFVVCVVTTTTSKTPRLSTYSGKEFLERFKLDPIQFYAKLCP